MPGASSYLLFDVEISEGLRSSASRAPELPGVYSFLDGRGRVLYIGKALNLRNRLMGHLSTRGDARHDLLLKRSVSIEWTITDTEVDALVLEAELIRIRKPPLNVRLRASGRYPYLEITLDEEWPRLQVTRERSNPFGRPRFGPYPDSRNLRRLIDFLLEMHPLRRCSGSGPTSTGRSCLMGQMGRCPAPCIEGIDRDEYLLRVDRIRNTLKGDWKKARMGLEKAMSRASESRDYEEAARLRDLVARLRSFGWPAPEGVGERINRDAVSVRENWGVVMRVRGGRVTCVARIPFDGRWKLADEEERLSILLRDYYGRTEDIPREVLLPCQLNDEGSIARWLTERRGASVNLSVPQRGGRRQLLELASRNLEEFLVRLSWKRPAGGREKLESALESLADILGLKEPPDWIVCLDASTIQGSWPVAAIVSFRGGHPDRSGYRRYSMPSELSRNDPGMIASAVERFMDSLEDQCPDIFLVDGGITQLRAAAEAAGGRSWEGMRILSIAKREELLIEAGTERRIRLPMDSTPLTFLRSIRDEAHRFVLHYHQQKRSRGSLRSILDDIPGIGAATRTRLLTHFGSAERIAAAELNEIMNVPGVGRKRAILIKEHLETAGMGGSKEEKG